MTIDFAKKMKEMGVKPEIEVFEKGMIDNAMKLFKKGLIDAPIQFNIVLGVNGAMSATPRDLTFMVDSLPKDATWCGTGIGRSEFDLAAVAIVMGGNVRVGFEDNSYLSKGVLAKSNGELVDKVVKLAKLLNREIATPEDARRILGLV
jgi:3-keto-5-aminohexanoate cleavage enzyme